MDDATAIDGGRTGVRRRAAVHGRRPRACRSRPPALDACCPRERTPTLASRRGSTTWDPTTCALSPDEAGRLAADLAAAGRLDALALVVSSTPPHRYPLAAPADRRRACPSTTAAVAPSSGRWRWRPAAAALGARRGRRRSAPSARCSPRSPRRAELAAGPPYRWWGAPEMTMAEPPGTRRSGPETPTTPSSATARRPASPTPASTSPGPSAPTWWWSTSPSRSPSASSPARTAAWSPARRWSCRSARPSSSTSSSSTTRRRSRSPAARARGSPSPTWRPSRR